MDVREVGPIFGSGTKGLSVAYIRISSFDALDLVLDEAVVGRWDSLSLFWRSVNNRRLRDLLMINYSNRHNRLISWIWLIDHQHISWHISDLLQKILRSEERMTQMKLISCRKKQATHVHRQKIGAMTAANRHSLEQASARNTHREDSVAKGAVDVTELLGGREVVR